MDDPMTISITDPCGAMYVTPELNYAGDNVAAFEQPMASFVLLGLLASISFCRSSAML
jgi:hypothetical protein